MKSAFILFISLSLTVFSTVVFGQSNKLLSSKPKQLLDSLQVLDSKAKEEYQNKTTHPKLVKRDFSQDSVLMNQLSVFKKIVIEYDARNMVFNSLFVKSIVENPQVEFFFFTTQEGILWVKNELDTDYLLNQLNGISMTPVTLKMEVNNFK